VDRRLIEEKLEVLRRCVLRVEAKCPSSAADLAADQDRQDIIALNLTRAVQLSVDIAAHLLSAGSAPVPDTMGGMFDRLAEDGVIEHRLATQMKKAVGFRNIAVHNYQAIDWEIVFAICRKNLGDFREFAAAVARRLS
jgi:uncharacterized protein YutE (UPF0331/DUF86 family)